jgi:cell division protein FtsB
MVSYWRLQDSLNQQVEQLVRENESLRRENEQLKKEIDKLRKTGQAAPPVNSRTTSASFSDDSQK